MDLAFTPDELAFREEIRAWVKANLPSEISQKVHSAMRLSRDDLQLWAKILGKKGWLGWGWPEQFGGPGWTAVQKHLFEEECALAGALAWCLSAPSWWRLSSWLLAMLNSKNVSCQASPAVKFGGVKATANLVQALT